MISLRSRLGGRLDSVSWITGHPRLTIGLIGVLGFAAAALLAVGVFHREAAQVDAAFQRAASQQASAIERGWRVNFDAAAQLAQVFVASRKVTRREFHLAARSILARHDSIKALEWVPRVAHDQRNAFVSRARSEFPGFDFVDIDDNGNLRPVGHRDVYYPVYYIEPLSGNERALGYDPAHNGVRRSAIRRAVSTADFAVSQPTVLIQNGDSATALLTFVPVFHDALPNEPTAAERRSALKGLVEGVFVIDDLTLDAISVLDPQGLLTDIHEAGSSDSPSVFRYGVTPVARSGVFHWPVEHSYQTAWTVGGRHFNVRITSLGGRFDYDLREALIIVVITLGLTSAVMVIVAQLLRRERYVTQLVHERSEALHHQATHDDLTGLPNRAEFHRRVRDALNACRRTDRTYALCYIDLDQFKVVNDVCGHTAGDELLRQLGDHLSKMGRGDDVLARLGGDEFALLLPGCDANTARHLAERYQRAIAAYRFLWDDRIFAIGASIGVSEINARTRNPAEVLSQADAACYIAKDKGRNRIHLFEAEDTETDVYRRQMEWVSEIRHALEESRLELDGQAIVPCQPDTDMPRILEILVRLRSRGGEIIPPGAFIPAAERYDMMPEIDRWVVREAMRRMSDVAAEGEVWSINLSGRTLGDDAFADYVVDCLERYRIPAGAVCFEITETAVVASLSAARRFIARLHAAGCLFALDDFGSGMSSFTYLKHLPVEYVKIDGAFIRDLPRDRVDRAMVSAILQVAKELRILTVAEFVESAEVLQEVRRMGVDMAQGFHIEAPTPLNNRTVPRALPMRSSGKLPG
jgi:diguanylate cyclase (GGDEF)-like protein